MSTEHIDGSHVPHLDFEGYIEYHERKIEEFRQAKDRLNDSIARHHDYLVKIVALKALAEQRSEEGMDVYTLEDGEQ